MNQGEATVVNVAAPATNAGGRSSTESHDE